MGGKWARSSIAALGRWHWEPLASSIRHGFPQELLSLWQRQEQACSLPKKENIMVMNHCVEMDFLYSVSTRFPSPRAVGCDATVALALYLCFVISKRFVNPCGPWKFWVTFWHLGKLLVLWKDLALSNEDWCFWLQKSSLSLCLLIHVLSSKRKLLCSLGYVTEVSCIRLSLLVLDYECTAAMFWWVFSNSYHLNLSFRPHFLPVGA